MSVLPPSTMMSSPTCNADVCASVCASVLSSLNVGMMTEIVIATSGGGFLWLVEHEIHDDDHGAPENDLLVPEQNLAKLEKTQRNCDGSDRDSPPEQGM